MPHHGDREFEDITIREWALMEILKTLIASKGGSIVAGQETETVVGFVQAASAGADAYVEAIGA